MIDLAVGVIGGGVVGLATAKSYLEHVKEVRVYDILPERSTHHLHETVCDSDVVFICLPTPQKKNSLECDTSIVEEFFTHCGGLLRNRNFVLRSTVPIGFTRRMAEKYQLTNLVHSPEFLTARCALVDAQMPSRNIIGLPYWNELTGPTGKGWDHNTVKLFQLYTQRWPHVPTEVPSSDVSEAVKLGTNGFFAAKVAFWNELQAFLSSREVDWETVRRLILMDGRIHPSHTQVPGPDGKYGFGGTCLPKDIASLTHQMEQVEHDGATEPMICKAAILRNESDRKRGK